MLRFFLRQVLSRSSRRREPSRAVRLKLEPLETRVVPVVTLEYLPTDAMLRITGDNQANRIAVDDDGAGGIHVVADGRSQDFDRVGRIEVRSGGGGDTVAYGTGIYHGDKFPPYHPADLMMDLGRGDDTVTLSGTGLATDESKENPGPWTIDIMGDEGNDEVHADVATNIPLLFAVDLGRGDDRADLAYTGGPGWMTGPHEVSVTGSGGTDDIRVRTEIVIPGALSSPESTTESPLQVNIDGGGGDDSIIDDNKFTFFSGGAELPPGPCRIPVATNITGGDGADDIGVIYGYTFRGSPGTGGVVMAGPISIGVDSGTGADIVAVNFFTPGPDDAPVSVTTMAPVAIDLRGGDGADRIDANVGPGVEFGARIPATFHVLADGGNGDDAVRVALTFNGQEPIDIRVFGGRGNDNLALQVAGSYDPDTLTAQVQGGPGFDRAEATRNVQVNDCEDVRFV